MRARASRVSVRLAAVAAVLALLSGCSGRVIPPTYTEQELEQICIRNGGWWRPDGLRGGFCEYDSRA
jgi:hypothetical protein